MSTESFEPGSPFSWGFFTRGVPQMLRRRLFGPRPAEPAFVSHTGLGQLLALVACLGLAGVSAPLARERSIVGILLVGAGVAGAIALVIHSAWEAREYPISPDAFAIGPFLACVFLGGDLGLAISRGADVTTMTHMGYAAMGMVVGYVVGSLVGLYTQRLGWIAGIFSFFAFVASAGLILLAVVLFA